MKHVIEADPEMGTYLIFEPAVVLDEFKAANANGTHKETVNVLHTNRSLIFVETSADECGTLQVYQHETPPENLAVGRCGSPTLDVSRRFVRRTPGWN